MTDGAIRIVGGKLKGPSALTINGMIFRLSVGDGIHQAYAKWSGDQPGNRIVDSMIYRATGGTVIISADEGPHGTLLHASIALDYHDPSWDLIKALKAVVFGDIDAMMVLPKASLYVNVHQHAFHLWQMPVEWGIA